ncbi:hypothetical protein H0H92_008516 [Tricholoma furcatifolium]|nr:hypothetical protein H0H92_008516 [Tricholoma furcatifolium]
MKVFSGDQPSSVLDASGYVICPDCGGNINCGKVGIANLETRHRGSKACREAAQKRNRDQKQPKNATILSYLKKRPTPVPSTVKPAQLLLASTSVTFKTNSTKSRPLISSKHEAQVVSKLRDLIVRLPPTIPEGSPVDDLAIFGKDPAAFDIIEMSSEDLWESMMNPTLKSVLGWGHDLDLTKIVKRGPLGMDGFLTLVKYFVDTRNVAESLVEGKLTHLMETLECL